MGLCISTHSSSSSGRTTRTRTSKHSKASCGGDYSLEEGELGELPNRNNRWVSNTNSTTSSTSNGCASSVASLYTRQGKKGTNQDAMILWENFASQADSVFCGVFDGHGPYGHFVATNVRNSFPIKLLKNIHSLKIEEEEEEEEEEDLHSDIDGDDDMFPEVYVPLKRAITKACKLVDKELKLHPTIDCFCSGSTAVTLVKQGHDLIIANIGDSRAVLATRDDDNNFNAVQLTVDLKPNLPREAERIQKCRGRVFALQDEPDVSRVWLPNNDSPGLAMARSFGDFCLKDYGLISVPDVSYHRLTEKDAFVILATDGIWDALSNKEAVHIVASAPSRRTAARALVDCAVRSWHLKYPTSKVDDCAVVCLFFDFASSEKLQTSKQASPEKQEQNTEEEVVNSHTQAEEQVINSTTQAEEHVINLVTQAEEQVINQVQQAQSPSLARFDTLSGNCSEIEIVPVIEEEGLSCRPHEQSQSTRSLAECILMPDEEEWSALEGITRVNSLLSLPRFLLRDKESSSLKRKL